MCIRDRLRTSHLIDMQKIFYTLSPMEIRRIDYELTEQLKLKHNNFNRRKMAGKDWLLSFLLRHLDISVRKPDATSFSRAIGFIKSEVAKVIEFLHSLIVKHNLQGR